VFTMELCSLDTSLLQTVFPLVLPCPIWAQVDVDSGQFLGFK